MNDGVDRSELTPEELAEVRNYRIVIEWSPEDGAFLASAPDLPRVRTHGATPEEAAAMGEEVVAIWLTSRRKAGLPIPPPSLTAKDVVVKLPPRYDAARIQAIRHGLNVSQKAFADMLNVSLATVRAWEQGLRTPDGAATRLLSIAERHPEIITEAVSLPARKSA